MTKTYYDDFKGLAKDKMAQAMTDMTFNYQETKVPKAHYKKQLDQAFEETVEASVSVNLVGHILGTLQALQKESPRLFFQALLCLDMKIKPASITASQYQAMTATSDIFEQQKRKFMLDKDLINYFNQVDENGLTYVMNNGGN